MTSALESSPGWLGLEEEEGLDPSLCCITTAQTPPPQCFRLSSGETANLASGPCQHIYSFENAIATAIQAEQEEMQNSRTPGGFLPTDAICAPTFSTLPAQGQLLLPAGATLLGQAAPPQPWPQLPSSRDCPLHVADISATEL